MYEHMPLVSIITPCYQGESFVDRYFNSILDQTYPNIELIFVNDGSNDRTEEIALSYETRLKKKGYSFQYLYQDNSGQAAAINKGLKIFHGDYLTWPDSDDIMTADCIEKKVDFLETHSDMGMVMCKVAVVSEEDLNTPVSFIYRDNLEKHDVFEDMLYHRDVCYMPVGWMVRSSAFLSVIPNREIYPGRGGQNVQLLFPITYRFSCGFITETLAAYVLRNDSHSHIGEDDYHMTIRRYEEWEDVTIHAIDAVDMSEKEKEYYKNIIRESYAHRRFNAAYANKDKQELRKAYKILRVLKKADKGLMKSYYEIENKYAYYGLVFFETPIQFIKDAARRIFSCIPKRNKGK